LFGTEGLHKAVSAFLYISFIAHLEYAQERIGVGDLNPFLNPKESERSKQTDSDYFTSFQ
jgi:hypothetical protein